MLMPVYAQPPNIPVDLGSAELTIFVFALIGLNLFMLLKIDKPVLVILTAFITCIMGVPIENVLGFPWLNLLLTITAIYSIVASYKTVKG